MASETVTREDLMELERFFFAEERYSFREMLTRYKAVLPDDPVTIYDRHNQPHTRAEIILDLMREFYPLETMVWEQERKDADE